MTIEDLQIKPIITTYEILTDPSTYGINPDTIVEVRYSDVKGKIRHTNQLEDGNILVASHMPLLYLNNSKQAEIGRIYLAINDPVVLMTIDRVLQESSLFYFMKVSTDAPRIDQVCIYSDVRNNESTQILIDSIRKIYIEEKDRIVPIKMPLAATLKDKEGVEMVGINFKQSSPEYTSPNLLLARSIDAVLERGTLDINSLSLELKDRGYDPNFPAFLEGSNYYDEIREISTLNQPDFTEGPLSEKSLRDTIQS